MNDRPLRDLVGLPQVLFALLAVVHVLASARLNGGSFGYTLDDPYIHLALAESLARGHYGLCPGIAAAASSSALWPLLLAPFGRLAVVEWVPLAINMVASLATIAITRRLVDAVLDVSDRRTRAVAVALTTAAFLSLNVVGVAFTGMEHAPQLTAAVAVVWGLIRVQQTRHAPWWPYGVLPGGLGGFGANVSGFELT